MSWHSAGSRGFIQRYGGAIKYSALALIPLVVGYSIDAITPAFVLMAIFALIGVFILSLPYSSGIAILFVYLCFEGMLKMLSNYNPVIHVGGDLLVVGMSFRWVLAWFLKRTKAPDRFPPLTSIFICHVIWFFIEFINPYGLGLIPSLAGAKLFIIMVHLYFYGYYICGDIKKLHLYMGIWVFIIFVQTVTTLWQAAVGPQSVLAISSAYAAPLKKFGSTAFRPYGTTALPGGPSVFIGMSFVFLVYFVFVSKNLLTRLFLVLLMPLSIGALMVCQTRSAIMKSIIETAIFVMLASKKASAAVRKKILIGVPVVAVVLGYGLPFITDQLVSTNKENASGVERSMTLFDAKVAGSARSGAGDRVIAHALKVPLGAGLSRTGAAAGAFIKENMASPFFREGFFADNLWAALIAEIGIPGTLIYTAFAAGMIWFGLLGIWRAESEKVGVAQAVLVSVLFSVLFSNWGSEGLLYNPESPFYWFFGGALVRLYTIASEEARAANIKRRAGQGIARLYSRFEKKA